MSEPTEKPAPKPAVDPEGVPWCALESCPAHSQTHLGTRHCAANLNRSVRAHAICFPAVRALKAESERLRAIVEKLPKLADGAPVVPGMPLWRAACDEIEPDGSTYRHPVEKHYSGPHPFLIICGRDGDNYDGPRDCRDYCSTREAAGAEP